MYERAGSSCDLRNLKARTQALIPKFLANFSVVKRRPRARQTEACRSMRSMKSHALEFLAARPRDTDCIKPWSWDSACGRRSLTNFITINDKNVSVYASKGARHRKSCEARAANRNIWRARLD